MGRKIPARKHHGVKDPELQQKTRFDKIKDAINAPPVDVEDQEVPKKLQRLMKMKDKGLLSLESLPKEKKILPKKKKAISSSNMDFTEKPVKGMEKPLKPIPIFEQMPGEDDKHFLYRTEMIARDFLKKAAFEKKYDVDVIPNVETGEMQVQKRKKDELMDNAAKPANRRQLKLQRKKERLAAAAKEAKKKALLVKKQAKEERKQDAKNDDFSYLKDEIKFGEVAEAPPLFPVKGAKEPRVPKPGKRDLLLKQMLPASSPSSAKRPIKQKDLPSSQRLALEQERERAVQSYRAIVASKRPKLE